jgi:hypothetical protein
VLISAVHAAREVLMAKVNEVPVSERALIQRINRKLGESGLKIRAARPRAVSSVGRYYVVDWRRNAIVDHHIDLEAYGRKHKVIQPYEGLAE